MSIVINSLTYLHPNRELLFQRVNFSVSSGEKAALVGPNGVGKSTLLQLLAGQLRPSEGEIIVAEKPYYVPQHLRQFDALTVAQLLGIDQKIKALHAILAGDVATDHFTQLGDDWDIEERVQAALATWGIAHLALSQGVQTLSGGEKTKVFLAGIQIHSPGILLLDEPSNHLDTKSREQLYDFIQAYKATMLVVSHDRALLNQLDTTIELNQRGAEVFGGNYDFYRDQKEGKLRALQAQLNENEKTLKQTQQKARDVAEQRQKQEVRGKAQGQKQALPRIIAGGRKSQAEQSTAKLKDAQNEKITDLTDQLRQIRTQIQEQQILKIDLRKSDLHRGKLLIDATAINFAYTEPAQPLWASPLSFQVRSGDRIRVEGNNGSGKTTLLNLMTGRLKPTTGTITTADFQYAYLDQEYSLVDNQLTVFEQVKRFNTRRMLEHELKVMLHYYQFPRAVWDQPCAGLSGGEKMKLALCCLAVGNNAPDLLILDEPTNNLDRKSQEVLTHAIQSFEGTVLVISHDHYFIEEIKIHSTISLC